MNVKNTSRIVSTPEQIVRDFRILDRRIRIEIPVSTKPISTFEKAIRIFLFVAAGWVIGYMHCFRAMR